MTAKHVTVNIQVSLTLLAITCISLKGPPTITRDYPVRGSAVLIPNCSADSNLSGFNFILMKSSSKLLFRQTLRTRCMCQFDMAKNITTCFIVCVKDLNVLL